MDHWARQLRSALEAGKTIFIVLDEYQSDTGANSSSYSKGQRLYTTSSINNYQALPLKITVKNTKGRKIVVADNSFKGLLDVIKEIAEYRVIFDPAIGKKIFTTKDGATIASSLKIENLPGNLVFLPYFNFEESNRGDKKNWSNDSIRISKALVSQLVAIDQVLNKKGGETPPPPWHESIEMPKKISLIDKVINDIKADISSLEKRKETELEYKNALLEFSYLLYETGKSLEAVIEKSLKLFGYLVENYRKGDIEIDHVIISPDGPRMIGESGGKDNTPIAISKFRQLESNINEDFEREDIDVPAKGILFGNGFRFIDPNARQEQFTQKCLVNAKRVGTALIRTVDLYKIVVYVLDHPDDELFKKECRHAIETTIGGIVNFPSPSQNPQQKKNNKSQLKERKSNKPTDLVRSESS